MTWHVIHTKPKQEHYAAENLSRQGFNCFLPTISAGQTARDAVNTFEEPLFSRYFFAQLGEDQSFSLIRSTKGVSRVVTIDGLPVTVSEQWIVALKAGALEKDCATERFNGSEKPQLLNSISTDVEEIYQFPDGERRALMLIELLSRRLHPNTGSERLKRAG